MNELKDRLMLVWRKGLKLLQARDCMVGVGCAVVAGTSTLPWSTGGTSAKCTTGSSEVSCPVKILVPHTLLTLDRHRHAEGIVMVCMRRSVLCYCLHYIVTSLKYQLRKLSVLLAHYTRW